MLKLRFRFWDNLYGFMAWLYWGPDFLEPITVKLFIFAWDRLHAFIKKHDEELERQGLLNYGEDDRCSDSSSG